MRSFVAFFKKELLECTRRKKLLILGLVFFVFGAMNPLTAKLTPLLFELLAEDFAEIGMSVPAVTADALASWAQFFKNISTALIVFVLICGNAFTKEYGRGTLVLVLTKGLARYKVLLAKTAVLMGLWTVCYWLCYGVTLGGTALLFETAVVDNVFPAALCWWLFGVFITALVVLFSVLFNNYALVLLGTGGTELLCSLLALLPRLMRYLPTALMDGMSLLAGTSTLRDYLVSIILTAALSIAAVAVAIPIFNKKQL